MSSRVKVLARIGIDADALLDHPGQDRPSMNVHRLLTGAITEVGGALSLVKNDASTWVLTETNFYTGTTTLDNGILRLDAAQDLAGALQLRALGPCRAGRRRGAADHGDFAPAPGGRHPGARHFRKPQPAHQLDERIQLVGVAGHLVHEALRRGIDHPRPKGLRQP